MSEFVVRAQGQSFDSCSSSQSPYRNRFCLTLQSARYIVILDEFETLREDPIRHHRPESSLVHWSDSPFYPLGCLS
jgi:hypothetical protein